jgi:hypothetical protein
MLLLKIFLRFGIKFDYKENISLHTRISNSCPCSTNSHARHIRYMIPQGLILLPSEVRVHRLASYKFWKAYIFYL